VQGSPYTRFRDKHEMPLKNHTCKKRMLLQNLTKLVDKNCP